VTDAAATDDSGGGIMMCSCHLAHLLTPISQGGEVWQRHQGRPPLTAGKSTMQSLTNKWDKITITTHLYTSFWVPSRDQKQH